MDSCLVLVLVVVVFCMVSCILIFLLWNRCFVVERWEIFVLSFLIMVVLILMVFRFCFDFNFFFFVLFIICCRFVILFCVFFSCCLSLVFFKIYFFCFLWRILSLLDREFFYFLDILWWLLNFFLFWVLFFFVLFKCCFKLWLVIMRFWVLVFVVVFLICFWCSFFMCIMCCCLMNFLYWRLLSRSRCLWCSIVVCLVKFLLVCFFCGNVCVVEGRNGFFFFVCFCGFSIKDGMLLLLRDWWRFDLMILLECIKFWRWLWDVDGVSCGGNVGLLLLFWFLGFGVLYLEGDEWFNCELGWLSISDGSVIDWDKELIIGLFKRVNFWLFSFWFLLSMEVGIFGSDVLVWILMGDGFGLICNVV